MLGAQPHHQAAQFCEWDKPDHKSARRVVRSLAFQLATRLPDYRKLLLMLPEIQNLESKDQSELFDYLLVGPLRAAIQGGRERHLILIDALDEADEGTGNPLADMLARDAERLPDWLGLVVTSRPATTVTAALQGINPLVLETSSEASRADLREYLGLELGHLLEDHTDPNHLIDQILER